MLNKEQFDLIIDDVKEYLILIENYERSLKLYKEYNILMEEYSISGEHHKVIEISDKISDNMDLSEKLLDKKYELLKHIVGKLHDIGKDEHYKFILNSTINLIKYEKAEEYEKCIEIRDVLILK